MTGKLPPYFDPPAFSLPGGLENKKGEPYDSTEGDYVSHKECRLCGKIYSLWHDKKFCPCGGFIYTISQVYQPKVKKEQ